MPNQPLLLTFLAAAACGPSNTAPDARPTLDAGGTGDAGGAADGAAAADAAPPPGGLLLRGTVLTPTGPLAGEVLIQGNLITCVAPSCSAPPTARVIDTGGIILPGMLDAHNHGLFDIFDEDDWTPTQFYGDHIDWTTTPRYTELLDAKQYLGNEMGSPVDVRCEMDKYAEVKALIAGTTSFLLAPGASRTCFASVVRTIDTPSNDLGADHVQTSVAVPSNTTAQSVCDNFADGSTNAYVVHVAEGVNTTALNELATFASRAGGCLMAPQTAIVHGTALGAPEFTTMAAAGMKLVWSPKVNLFLYDDPARADLALAAGVESIALAPDWSVGGSVNQLDELRVADAVDATTYGDVFTPERLFRMVTIDAARALGVDAELGSIEVGKRADLAVLSGGGPADPYDALLAATPARMQLVLVDGRPLYGDEALLDATPSDPPCDALDVCGVPKFLCIAEADPTDLLDQTFADIVAALEAALTSYDALVAPAGIAPFSPIAPITRCP